MCGWSLDTSNTSIAKFKNTSTEPVNLTEREVEAYIEGVAFDDLVTNAMMDDFAPCDFLMRTDVNPAPCFLETVLIYLAY